MFANSLRNLVVLIPLLLTTQSAAAASYALVVGIEDYPKSRKLNGSVRDAGKFAEFFSKQGFTEVKLLVNGEATRKGILDGFDYFLRKIKAGDNFYFFYAGHGTIFPDSQSDDIDEKDPIPAVTHPGTGKTIFAKGKYDSAICPVDHKDRTSGKRWGNIILDDELFEEFAEFAAKGSVSILISDSCHSGSLGRSLEPRGDRMLYPDEAYDKEAANTGSSLSISSLPPKSSLREGQLKEKYIALTAARDNQLAKELYFDAAKGEMGIFSFMLLEILNAKPYIALDALAIEMETRVSEQTKKQQVPQLERRFLTGDLSKTSLLRP